MVCWYGVTFGLIFYIGEEMIVIRLMGGLGNQLQQYALYLKFKSLGKEVYIDTSWFEAKVQRDMKAPRTLELSLFEGADFEVATKECLLTLLGACDITQTTENFSNTIKKSTNKVLKKLHIVPDYYFIENKMYHPEIFEMQNAYLEGYWASNIYYIDVLPTIREKLFFSNINNENRIMAADIAKQVCDNIHTCSVHIRRGDYLDPENAAMFGGIATENYYDSAFDFVKKEYPNTDFYIFSDDMNYAKERYGNDDRCHFVDINHDENSRFDIYLMSKCTSHICANSTFSFWGARLGENDGIVIRPSIHKNSQVFVPEEMHELWPGWVLIDPDGNVR